MQAQQQKTFNTALQKQSSLCCGKNVYISSNGIAEARSEIVSKQTLEDEEEHEEEVLQWIILYFYA